MPRAEIPEGLTRFDLAGSPSRLHSGAVFSKSPNGSLMFVSDLPKLYTHWLEQLKEELLSEEQIHALTQEIVEGSDGYVISLPYQVVKDALGSRLSHLGEETNDGT